MKALTLALLTSALLASGCATNQSAEQIEKKKQDDKAMTAFLGMALLASSMNDPESENLMNYESTISKEDTQVIEDLKKHFEETNEWMLAYSDVEQFNSIEGVDLREENNSLYCSILRTDETRAVLRIDSDLSVTYSTLPNQLYMAMAKSMAQRQQIEPQYTFWDAFFSALPQALSSR